jgi:hypothetical protein
MEGRGDRAKVAPLAPQRFALQLTIGQALHDKLRYAQELLSHQVPAGDVAAVLERALDALIPELEKRKFAATGKPCHRPRRSNTGGRHIPAEVKRAVWERDGGRCTFVSETGRRCPARRLLEFDHVEEVARAGRASVAGIRLRTISMEPSAPSASTSCARREKRRDVARRRHALARRPGNRPAQHAPVQPPGSKPRSHARARPPGSRPKR